MEADVRLLTTRKDKQTLNQLAKWMYGIPALFGLLHVVFLYHKTNPNIGFWSFGFVCEPVRVFLYIRIKEICTPNLVLVRQTVRLCSE